MVNGHALNKKVFENGIYSIKILKYYFKLLFSYFLIYIYLNYVIK